MTRKSKYILTADDYGACDFIDSAILKAIDLEKINSVACFAVHFDANKDEFDTRLDTLLNKRTAGKKFGIGLHFSLTAGLPQAQGAVDNGNGLTIRDSDDGKHYFLLADNYPFEIIEGHHLDEVEAELRAQLKRLRDKIASDSGDYSSIDSISCHHGIAYLSTAIFERFVKVAGELQVPIRSPRIWRNANLPHRNWDSNFLWNPLIRQGFWLRQLDRIRSARKFHERVNLTNLNNILSPAALVDEIYGQADPYLMEDLFHCFERETFSAEFMFHLGDWEVREDANIPEGKAQWLHEPWGIDANYFNWRERELRTLLYFDHRPFPADKINFRQLERIDFELPEKKVE